MRPLTYHEGLPRHSVDILGPWQLDVHPLKQDVVQRSVRDDSKGEALEEVEGGLNGHAWVGLVPLVVLSGEAGAVDNHCKWHLSWHRRQEGSYCHA